MQERNEGFSHAQFSDHLLDIKLRIGTKCLRHDLDRLLLLRRKGSQGVLHAVAQLG